MRSWSIRKDHRPFSSLSEIRSNSQVHLLTLALSCIASQHEAALASCHESHGVCVIVGFLAGVRLNISGLLFLSGRSLKGTIFGGMDETGERENA